MHSVRYDDVYNGSHHSTVISPEPVLMLLPFLLYAETHYRFKYFFSLYKKKEPEIIADGPYRLDPDASYPILILIKDADRYPVRVQSVKVTLYHNARKEHTFTFPFAPELEIRSHYWWKVLELPFDGARSSLFGPMVADVEITVRIGNRSMIVRNNNHRFTSKTPLKFYRSKTHLPSLPGWVFGDAHTHSTYTEDQVEFGSPIPAAPALCRAMGISFFGVTDHSYDLDDRTDSYLLNDPAIPKWHALQDEIDTVNRKEVDFAVLRGEEVSCTNANGNNVHYLLYGNRKFFHGSGDGGEKWFKTRSEYSIPDILEQKERGTVTFASHPTEEVPFLQRLLLKRDEWTIADMTRETLHGIQILNGERSEAFLRGLDIWKWMLQQGMKKFLLAGNDAHGNFNRFVQISIPMLSFREKDSQLFGKMKTGVLVHTVDEQSVLDAMALGRSVITNGPIVSIAAETDAPDQGMIGGTVRGNRFVVKIQAATTEEFGSFTSIRIILGTVGKGERTIMTLDHLPDRFRVHTISDWHHAAQFSYIRAEAFTGHGHGTDRDGFCYTNPIWIQPI